MILIKPVNELFSDAVDNWNYSFIKKSIQYDDGVAIKLIKMAKKTAVQIRD